MNIKYLANVRLPTEKAHGIQIMKMCEAFANQGNEVELIVPWRFNHIKEDPFEYYSVEGNFKITKIPSVDLIRFGRIGFWIHLLVFSEFATWYLLFKKVDVVYSRDEVLLFYSSLFKKNLFWETHTNRLNSVIRVLLRKIRGLIVITERSASFYKTEGVKPEKILISPDAVDLNEFNTEKSKFDLCKELNLPVEIKIIGHVGKYKTMGKHKGIHQLINAFVDLAKVKPEAFLLIVGPDQREIAEVRSLFDEAGVEEKRYKIIPHILHKEVVSYMKACDILVMNYPAEEHYTYYMSPLKLFEYMASGIPIVTSDLPAIREVLSEENALFFEASNQRDLTEKIKILLTDENLGEKLSKQALTDVREYTWEKRVNKIIEFINE